MPHSWVVQPSFLMFDATTYIHDARMSEYEQAE